jgi:hypothetical protein
MQGAGDHTKAGRSAFSPDRLTDQAEDAFQASPPSCDLFNSPAILGRFPLILDTQQPRYLPERLTHAFLPNRDASRCVSSALMIL